MADRAVPSLTREEWADARHRMTGVLIDVARSRSTITYGELAARVFHPLYSPRSPVLHELLREVCTEQDAERGIMLGSVVVRRDSGIPGGGYFRFAADALGRDVSDPERFWRVEVARVWDSYGGSGESAEGETGSDGR
jgi:hypothetical protein